MDSALSSPLNDVHTPQEVLASCQPYCARGLAALARLGLHGEYVPFSDIVVGRRKVAGTALARRGGCLLHHGTVLLCRDVGPMARVLRVRREHLEEKGFADVRRRVAALAQLRHPCTIRDARIALIDGSSEALDMRFAPDSLSAFEQALTDRLWKEQYSRPRWNRQIPAVTGQG